MVKANKAMDPKCCTIFCIAKAMDTHFLMNNIKIDQLLTILYISKTLINFREDDICSRRSQNLLYFNILLQQNVAQVFSKPAHQKYQNVLCGKMNMGTYSNNNRAS